jgi:hypothetical protein
MSASVTRMPGSSRGEEGMATGKKTESAPSASDEEIMRRILEDPEVQARIREIKDQIAKGIPPSEPGIGPEELAQFLRDLR